MAKLTMKRQREILAERYGCTNDFNLLSLVRKHSPSRTVLVVYYLPPERGRMSRPGGWYVSGGSTLRTDPGAHWMHNGQKFFYATGRAQKERVMTEAIAWASDLVDHSELGWAKTPFGGYMPDEPLADFLAEALAEPSP